MLPCGLCSFSDGAPCTVISTPSLVKCKNRRLASQRVITAEMRVSASSLGLRRNLTQETSLSGMDTTIGYWREDSVNCTVLARGYSWCHIGTRSIGDSYPTCQRPNDRFPLQAGQTISRRVVSLAFVRLRLHICIPHHSDGLYQPYSEMRLVGSVS